jgi:hypothetical protein
MEFFCGDSSDSIAIDLEHQDYCASKLVAFEVGPSSEIGMRGCAGDGFVGEENLRRSQFNAVNHDEGLGCFGIAEVVT